MSNFDNTNSGTIGKNKRKEKDTHPDIAGTLNVEGKEYWLNGWHKTNGQTGEGFYSLSVKPKDRQNQSTSAQNAEDEAGRFADDDDIVF